MTRGKAASFRLVETKGRARLIGCLAAFEKANFNESLDFMIMTRPDLKHYATWTSRNSTQGHSSTATIGHVCPERPGAQNAKNFPLDLARAACALLQLHCINLVPCHSVPRADAGGCLLQPFRRLPQTSTGRLWKDNANHTRLFCQRVYCMSRIQHKSAAG